LTYPAVLYFWIIIDPISGDEPKIVEAPSKLEALNVAADQWGYTEEEGDVRDEFVKEARIVPLTDNQVSTLGIAESDAVWHVGGEIVALYVVRWEAK